MITIRPLSASQWQHHKMLRLQSLLDSPEAFGSTYEAEHTRSDTDWAQRIATALASQHDRIFLAYHNDVACGLVWCKLATQSATTAELFQMWVAPAQRGHGAGTRLLDAAVHWAKNAGMRTVALGVTQSNAAAIHLYSQYGFAPVGEAIPLREGSTLLSQTMVLTLSP
ncbi:GNAT family N-acetyltransferase [Paenalcaligenes sp. Me131]|uniref:GNAT family N-acetyltransferase n=1 Tax=Paenalcaligenes sp. Me131 TaxID=3392636 RepID=UPI003D2C86A8